MRFEYEEWRTNYLSGSSSDGLIVFALHETGKQSLNVLMKNLLDLVNRTRAGTLRSSELSDSTITVTNLGEQSVETVFGVIYPPQVALVGFGKMYEDVSVIDGRIKGCFKINASLSADHQVEIAPEADLSALNPDLNFRDQIDLDSMDYLNFVIALDDEFGVEIPETDYIKFMTLNSCVGQLKKI